MLELEPEIKVVGAAERGEQAVSDIEATRLLKERHPDLVVVALTYLQDEHVAGASGYILKTCTADELVRAVRAAQVDRKRSPRMGW